MGNPSGIHRRALRDPVVIGSAGSTVIGGRCLDHTLERKRPQARNGVNDVLRHLRGEAILFRRFFAYRRATSAWEPLASLLRDCAVGFVKTGLFDVKGAHRSLGGPMR